MFSLGFLENIAGVAAWRAWFLENKSHFLLSLLMVLLSKTKALNVRIM